MGKSNDQVIGYKYFTNFLLFIGNPIEKLLGINFDKRGWIDPFTDEDESILDPGVINSPTLYGETEGGVAGAVYLKTGTNDQEVVPFYKDYMESKELQASAYPYQSYLAFKDFYVGNSGYMKEMLLWPKRIHVRNDGQAQWYDLKAEIDLNTQYTTGSDIFANGWGFINTGEYNSILRLMDGSNKTINNSLIKNAIRINFGTNPKSGDYGSTLATGYYNNPAFVRFVVGSYHQDVTIIFGGSIRVLGSKNLYSPNGYFLREYALIISGNYTIGITVKATTDGFQQLNLNGDFYANGDLNDWKIESGDMNPIHKIREILTDDTAMKKPELSVNDVNFMKAADRIYGEGLGVSWSITEKSCIDAINELCYHIEAGIRVNRQTGLYEIVLFRDNWFEENEIHTISESKIKSMQYEITNADEVINQVNVNFYDRANIKNSSFSISESGLIQTLGRVNAETLDFPYFMNMRNAEIVANWKLKLLSTGVYKGTFTTGWREARKWNRYDLIRLPWSKRWNGTILVRIMSINLGGPTNNEVSIDFIEVVPSTGMMNTTIVADDVIDKPLPPQSCQYEPFELPYYLAVMALGQRQVDDELTYENNFGLVGAVAEKPQENSLYAVMMTNNGDEWIRAGSIQYSQTVDLDKIISKTSSSFTVKNWRKIANVAAGTLIKCGRDWLGTPGEWMVFQGVDPYTGIVSVKRGALDTPPQEWGVNTKLYFCGNDISYDQTEYISSEEVLVSVLTTTPSGVLEQRGSIPVEMKARAIRPYPPANVKINGEYWPEEIETDLVLTWVDRDRLQQTGGSILGWFDSGVAIEPGTQTHLILTQLGENDLELATTSANLTGATSYTMPISIMQASTRTLRIMLKTVRDSYECLNPFIHTVELSQFFSAPYDLTVEFKND